MNKKFTLFLILAIPIFCLAQNPLPRVYEYDAAGNRVVRRVLSMLQAPPDPTDSLNSLISLTFSTPDYYLEKMGKVEIKIYPNPATEVVKLEVSNFNNLNKGVFKLYNLNGQLLQEYPVHSAATEVSLAGLAKGAYILKVQINERTEDWKIIKQ